MLGLRSDVELALSDVPSGTPAIAARAARKLTRRVSVRPGRYFRIILLLLNNLS
jgi:hypothetical protein